MRVKVYYAVEKCLYYNMLLYISINYIHLHIKKGTKKTRSNLLHPEIVDVDEALFILILWSLWRDMMKLWPNEPLPTVAASFYNSTINSIFPECNTKDSSSQFNN